MPHSNLYLAKLYNDLITNTPQTITMDIPSEVGQGRVSQTKIKHGVILSDWQMNYRSDMNVQGPVSKEYMQIIFCLNDGISWGILNGHRSMAIQKNESCIYAGHDGTEYICYKNISMSRTERTAIMEAKRIIDSQLAFAPSCEELSQQVHLSLTKLTRGFSSFYGMPIHQYIIEQRLIQAAQLLLDGDRNVGEVATIVGYGKPSNFAAAFKKKYGVAPKNYRASRFSNSK